MATICCNFYSHVINVSTSMNVIIPQSEKQQKYPTLYLLHGYTDDYTAWQRKTAIERYVKDYNIAVVMPEVQKSFYNNFSSIEEGYKYWDFISTELLSITRNLFPLSNKREDTYVAGLSMGGFGAFKLALNCPEKFSAAASLSGALEPLIVTEGRENEAKMIYGDLEQYKKDGNDLFEVSEKLAKQKKAPLPRLYQCCGTEDYLYESNVKFKNHIEALKAYDYTYEQAHGEHVWEFWDEYIQKTLAWLELERLEKAYR